MRKWLKIKVFCISSFILPYLRTRWFCKTGHHFSTTKIKEDDMNNVLLDKGIITPSGEINKDKINLVAGAITQSFAAFFPFCMARPSTWGASRPRT